jgi:hypothetical protein
MKNNYEYTGNCFLTAQVWNSDDQTCMWEKFRCLYMRNLMKAGGREGSDPRETRGWDYINFCIESTVRSLIEDFLDDDEWPLVSTLRWADRYGFELKRPGDWEAFILSLTEAALQYDDISYAHDDDDIQECAAEVGIEVIAGETADEFNKRLYNWRFELADDMIRSDFEQIKAQLMYAKIGFDAMESGKEEAA